MSNKKRILISVVAGLLNILYLGMCDYWQIAVKHRGVWAYIIIGIMTVVILALTEACIVIQLYYRKKYLEYKRVVFDSTLWIQVGILIFYYVSSCVFTYMLSEAYIFHYLIIVPIGLSTLLTKAGRVMWISEEQTYFLNEKSVFYRVKELRERNDSIELICVSSEQEEKMAEEIFVVRKKH
uniref:hypothetical protein n=1 Tax=Acetatifactor sp. TaxID=1872090 RepID=UPI0040559D7B